MANCFDCALFADCVSAQDGKVDIIAEGKEISCDDFEEKMDYCKINNIEILKAEEQKMIAILLWMQTTRKNFERVLKFQCHIVPI